jgi:hypothetical protein
MGEIPDGKAPLGADAAVMQLTFNPDRSRAAPEA